MTVTKHMTSRSLFTLVLPLRWLIFINFSLAVNIAIKQQQYYNTVWPQLKHSPLIRVTYVCLGQTSQSVYMRKSCLTPWGHPILQKGVTLPPGWPHPQIDPTPRMTHPQVDPTPRVTHPQVDPTPRVTRGKCKMYQITLAVKVR